MPHHYRAFSRAILITTTGLALCVASPVFAAPGKAGEGRHAKHHQCGHHGYETGVLSVTGTGEARVAPDMATVQLGVTSQAETAAEAMRQNATQQTGVIEALKGAGVDDADIQTSGLNLNPRMEYGDNRAPTVIGYEASNMVAVRVMAIGDLGAVLDAIVQAGANEIRGIDFGRVDGADAEDEARRAAVADARHKADVMAEAAGLTLGSVLVLRDGATSSEPRPMMRMAADMAQSESVPVQAGTLSMSAVVQIDYALVGAQGDCRHDGKGSERGGKGKHGKGGKKGGAGAADAMPAQEGQAEDAGPEDDMDSVTESPAAADQQSDEVGAGDAAEMPEPAAEAEPAAEGGADDPQSN